MGRAFEGLWHSIPDRESRIYSVSYVVGIAVGIHEKRFESIGYRIRMWAKARDLCREAAKVQTPFASALEVVDDLC